MTSDMLPQERAAVVAWRLCDDGELTVRDVCMLTGLKPRAARYLLEKLTRVLPIVHEDGVWHGY